MSTTLRTSISTPVVAPQKASLKTQRISVAPVQAGGEQLRSAFLGQQRLVTAFQGLAIAVRGAVRRVNQTGSLVVECNRKKGMQGNLQGQTKKAKARTSGFRTRMKSVGGRKVIKARRARGRKDIVPASIKPHK